MRSVTGKPAWQEYAACLTVDPEVFFPGPYDSDKPAKKVCEGCSVREACLEAALANHEKHGIWGGLSERERGRIRRERRLGGAA